MSGDAKRLLADRRTCREVGSTVRTLAVPVRPCPHTGTLQALISDEDQADHVKNLFLLSLAGFVPETKGDK